MWTTYQSPGPRKGSPLPFDLRSGVGAGRLRRGGGVAGGHGGHGIDREVAVALRRLVREVFGLDLLVRCRLGHQFEPDLVGGLLDDGRLDDRFRHDLLGRRVVAGRREDLGLVDGLREHRLRGLVRASCTSAAASRASAIGVSVVTTVSAASSVAASIRMSSV